MKLKKPRLYKGVFKHFSDERGYLNYLEINTIIKDINLHLFYPILQLMSFSPEKNTFRGLHFQKEPYLQSKILILHSGKILDFVVPFKNPKEENVERYDMTAGDLLLIPNTYAHGFLTKTSNVNIQYIIDNEFNKESYRGINATKYIKKLMKETKLIISEKDANFNNFLV